MIFSIQLKSINKNVSSRTGVRIRESDRQFDIIGHIKSAKMIFLIKLSAISDIFHTITHDTLLECNVLFVFIVLIHKLMRLHFFNSSCAAARRAAP